MSEERKKELCPECHGVGHFSYPLICQYCNGGKKVILNSYRPGKSNFWMFEEYCRAGKTALFHAQHYVAMDRKTYQKLTMKKSKEINGVLFSEEAEGV